MSFSPPAKPATHTLRNGPTFRRNVLNRRGSKGDPAVELQAVSTNLKAIFADGKRYSQLLSYRNEQAQLLLDILQALLDNPDFDVTFKSDLVVAMYKLSQRTSMYPRCFILMGVTLQGDRPIAEGSYGEIWKGQFGMHTVSLKVIKLYIKEPMERLFKIYSKEAAVWGQLSHRNLLPFYGTYRLPRNVEAGHKICLVSPWMSNGNINTFLRKNPNANRSSLISDIACGLAYLHENNVVHGDLKGANILVTRSPHRACLADFGLASICKPESRDHSIFTSTAPRGTLRWLAPELMMDEAIRSTRASDVYAFACVCYEVFTGNYPFPEIPRDTVVVLKVMRQELPNRPKDPLAILESRGLTDKVWDMMEECWQHDPTRRPTSAKLVRLLSGGSTTPPTRTSSKTNDASATNVNLISEWGRFSASSIRSESRGSPKLPIIGDAELRALLLGASSDPQSEMESLCRTRAKERKLNNGMGKVRKVGTTDPTPDPMAGPEKGLGAEEEGTRQQSSKVSSVLRSEVVKDFAAIQRSATTIQGYALRCCFFISLPYIYSYLVKPIVLPLIRFVFPPIWALFGPVIGTFLREVVQPLLLMAFASTFSTLVLLMGLKYCLTK